jgi:hypothetical protein
MSFQFAKYSYSYIYDYLIQSLHCTAFFFVSAAGHVFNMHVLCIQPSLQTFSGQRRFYPSTVRELLLSIIVGKLQYSWQVTAALQWL